MFEIVFEKANDSLLNVLRHSVDECERLKNRWVCSEHILLSLALEQATLPGGL